MMGCYWVPERESYVTELEEYSISLAMVKGYDIVVDAMNLNPETVAKFRKTCELHNKLNPNQYDLEFKKFTDVPLETCIERDKARPDRTVGELVIRGIWERYLSKK